MILNQGILQLLRETNLIPFSVQQEMDHCVHSWDISNIFEQSRNGSLENGQKGHEVLNENKRIYDHI